jgi:hypothetical protein
MSLSLDKLDALKLALANTDIAAWYKNEHGVTLDDFECSNVTLYGGPGRGDLSDMIIEDGIKAGVVPSDWDDE